MALKTILQADLDAAVAASLLCWRSKNREGYYAALSGYDFTASAVTIANYACLVDGRFTKTRFNTLNLTGTDFSNIDGRYSMFRTCNLTSADFSHADLYGADFTNANLTNADFSGAAMQNAILTGATLTGARFDNCDRTGAIY